jgi:hypothetical protein
MTNCGMFCEIFFFVDFFVRFFRNRTRASRSVPTVNSAKFQTHDFLKLKLPASVRACRLVAIGYAFHVIYLCIFVVALFTGTNYHRTRLHTSQSAASQKFYIGAGGPLGSNRGLFTHCAVLEGSVLTFGLDGVYYCAKCSPAANQADYSIDMTLHRTDDVIRQFSGHTHCGQDTANLFFDVRTLTRDFPTGKRFLTRTCCACASILDPLYDIYTYVPKAGAATTCLSSMANDLAYHPGVCATEYYANIAHTNRVVITKLFLVELGIIIPSLLFTADVPEHHEIGVTYHHTYWFA